MTKEFNTKELRDIAVELYTNKDNPHTYDNGKCMAFIDGVKWAEENPSDKLVKKIIYLMDKRGLTLGYYSIGQLPTN